MRSGIPSGALICGIYLSKDAGCAIARDPGWQGLWAHIHYGEERMLLNSVKLWGGELQYP